MVLINLASALHLDLKELYAAQSSDDRGRVRTILKKSEDELNQYIANAWSQGKISASLELDGYRLQILIASEVGEYVRVIERSDGLRQFVALLMFLACRSETTNRKPILLIDEAESRLHYDAQADLIQVFAQQQLAAKIIYTTHSMGCLPEDLGSGIRMVSADDPYSRIENYFWNLV